MPETDTTTQEIAEAPITDAPASPETADSQPESPADLGDGGQKAIAAEREARKAAEKQLRELQKSLKEYEDRDKSELQKAIERADEAEKRAATAEFNALRNKVAAAKGVPATSLTGSTEDELMASADELIAWRDQNKPPAPAPKRSPASGSGLKSGASGTENTNHDPKAIAAEALRRLRQSG